MDAKFVDTVVGIKEFVELVDSGSRQPPILYVDLEGHNLCRNGTLSLMTVLLEPAGDLYLIDITTLGRDAFNISSAGGMTLKSILESSNIIKVFFDIRNDSDALYGLFGIRVAGIQDLQLLELASRNFSKRTVNGLSRCVENEIRMESGRKREWQAVKSKGKDLFAPERGGSYSVFDKRPLADEIKQYCIQDVQFMPRLRAIYQSKLCDAWWRKIDAETAVRIQLSQGSAFNGKGRHMALGPHSWLSWNPSPEEKSMRTLF